MAKANAGKATARKYQVISTDGHIEMSPSNWFKYVPDVYKGWAPREISLPEGGEAWMIEGSELVYNGQNASGGIEGEGVKMKNVSY